MTRRSTHVDHDVVYASAGASAAPDLQKYPPEGATAYYEELKLGSGGERFLTASSLLMTWGAQRAIGLEVLDIVQGDGTQYAGVSFNERGMPEASGDTDVQYGPDGEPYLTAGTTATLRGPNGRADRKVRVVYTIDEPRRIGFAWGNSDRAPVIGEEAFIVEHRDDDSVWATVRGFVWATADGLLGIKGKSAIRIAVRDAKLQIAALAPGVVEIPAADEDQAEVGDTGVGEISVGEISADAETSTNAELPSTPESADKSASERSAEGD